MNIAITGATGFIGRHLLKELELSGAHKITIAVRALPCSVAINKATTVIVPLDLDDDIENAFDRLGRPELLIHLAWGSLTSYDSEDHIKNILPRHYSFLAHMVEKGVKSIAVTGTCLEYGMLSGQLSEDACCNPVTKYGLAKNLLNQQLINLKDEYDFSLTWFRLFYIDGDNPVRPTLYSALKKAVDEGDEYFNMSEGDQLRDFIPLQKAVLIVKELALKMLDLGAVNVCSGYDISVKSYVSKKIKENDWNIKLNLGYYPYPEYEPLAFWGDVQKLHKVSEKYFESRN